MSVQEHKAIVRSFLDALNTQDLSALDDIVAPDYYDHTNQFRGLDSARVGADGGLLALLRLVN